MIDGKQGLPFRAAEGDELAAIPGVTAVSHVRSDTGARAGRGEHVSGVDPATIGHFYRFKWSAGSAGARQLGADGALVTKTTPRTST